MSDYIHYNYALVHLGGLLPRNKVFDRIILNKGDSIELKYSYSLIFACETARNGGRALFATGWKSISKWNGDSIWSSTNEPNKFCIYALEGDSYILKNDFIDNGVFDIYVL